MEGNMTNIKNQNVRRAYSAFFLLALLVSMFGGTVGRLDLGMVSVASACQTGKPCEDANGSPTIQEPKEEEVVTVDVGDVQATVVSLSNNGGGTPNLNAQGVQTQAINGTNNSTITLSVPAGAQLTLPAETNATVIYTEILTSGDPTDTTLGNTTEVSAYDDVMDGSHTVSPHGKPEYCTTSETNAELSYAEFVALARSWSQFWQPNEDHTVYGWAHYVIPVYTEGPNGWSIQYVETSNSDNELVTGRGGWPNKSTNLWKQYNDNLVHFPDQVSCP